MEEFKKTTLRFLERRRDIIGCLSPERPTVDTQMDFSFEKFRGSFEELQEQVADGFDVDDVNVKLLYLDSNRLGPSFWYLQFAKKF